MRIGSKKLELLRYLEPGRRNPFLHVRGCLCLPRSTNKVIARNAGVACLAPLYVGAAPVRSDVDLDRCLWSGAAAAWHCSHSIGEGGSATGVLVTDRSHGRRGDWSSIHPLGWEDRPHV